MDYVEPYRVAPAKWKNQRSQCPECGRQHESIPSYGVMLGNAVLCQGCAEAVAPDLAKIASLVPPDLAAETPKNPYVSVYASKGISHSLCGVTDEPINARTYEIAGDNRRCISVAAGEDRSPALAMALHAFYGTSPAPRAVQPPPPPPREETPQERDCRERRAQALKSLSWAFGNSEKAQAAFYAVELLLNN